MRVAQPACARLENPPNDESEIFVEAHADQRAMVFRCGREPAQLLRVEWPRSREDEPVKPIGRTGAFGKSGGLTENQAKRDGPLFLFA